MDFTEFHGNGRFSQKTANFTHNVTAVKSWIRLVPSHVHTTRNWMALWKNWISSTTMKQRKSLVKPATWQNISSCLVLPPQIVMHNALMLFSERPPIYALCMMISGGRTEQLHITAGFLPHHLLYEWFSSAENVRQYMCHAWRSRVEEPNNTF